MTVVSELRPRFASVELRSRPAFRAAVESIERETQGKLPRGAVEQLLENAVVLGLIQSATKLAARTAAKVRIVLELADRVQIEYARVIQSLEVAADKAPPSSVTGRLQELTNQLTKALDDIGDPASEMKATPVGDLVEPPRGKPGTTGAGSVEPRLSTRPRPAHIPPENVVHVVPRKVGGHWDIPDLEPNQMQVFPNGERVWRTPDGEVVIEWVLSRGRGRKGTEKGVPSRGEYDLPDYADALYERAHSAGQWLGFESPHGIPLAAREVNQRLQRWGVEEFLARLHRQFPYDEFPDVHFEVTTTTRSVSGTRRLAAIDYRVDVIRGGARDWLMQFAIEVDGPRGNPRLSVPPDSVVVGSSPLARTVLDDIDMSDVHAMFAEVDRWRPLGRKPPPLPKVTTKGKAGSVGGP